MISILFVSVLHAAGPPSPVAEQEAQALIQTMEQQQEVLQAINVDGLMALIDAYEANEVYAADICEPATADVEAAPADTSEVSPLLVPIK
jgi:hypothetical protein